MYVVLVSRKPLIQKMIYTTGDLVTKVTVSNKCEDWILILLAKHIHHAVTLVEK